LIDYKTSISVDEDPHKLPLSRYQKITPFGAPLYRMSQLVHKRAQA
jgi:hypothetical protein